MIERQRLGQLIKDILRRHDLDRRAAQQAAVGLWAETVGQHIARNAWPLGVREGVLLVGAANHAWAQTLHLMRAQILDALNARLAEVDRGPQSAAGSPGEPRSPLLRDIKVRVARGPKCAVRTADGQRATARGSRPPLPPLTPEEQQRVRDLAAAVEDPDLRARVARAAAGLLRRRRAREAQSSARGKREGLRSCARCGRVLVGRGRTCAACAARR
jgi:hypothetical protein